MRNENEKLRKISKREMALLKDIYPFPANLMVHDILNRVIDVLNEMGLAKVLNNNLHIYLDEDNSMRLDFTMGLIISVVKDRKLSESLLGAIDTYKDLILSGKTTVKTDIDNIAPFREN